MHIVGEAPKRARTGVSVVFDDFDLEGFKFPHDDPLVITPIIGNNPMKRNLVDNGDLVDILIYDTFIRMGYNDQLIPTDMPIYGFAGVECPVEGIIKLPLRMGQEPRQFTQMLNFVVVKAGSTYNAFMGGQFPIRDRIGEEGGDQKIGRRCYVALLRADGIGRQVLPIEDLDIHENDEKRGKLAEDLISVPLAPEDPRKVIFIGASLEETLRRKLVRFLQENKDVFAWTAADIPGIDMGLITHKLNMDPNRKTVKQKKRIFAPERQEAIKQEVEKLLEAGFIKELQFSEWDKYSDRRNCGHEMLNIMDGFSGYNQIKMHEDDILKPQNAGATYQRLVIKIFKDLIGKTMEVYVDDMLVKSLVRTDHVSHLKEAFEVLRYHKMMLNPTKCAFGVGFGKFLGLMVSKSGIVTNPDKMKAILDMEPLRFVKYVQKLTGRVTSLGRLISKSGDK
ncbi:uncharacterized protein LOC141690504 [Apium graveolens]|uniref:uncharacterized protein LOC141690504 n=1 Tax=Apium graveolens TaxID=4045 RepID=UPI003D7BA6C5